MRRYRIEHRIETLLDNAIFGDKHYPSFEVGGIKFDHWSFSRSEGWVDDSWVAQVEVEANNYIAAINNVRQRLSGIIPQLALIGQCYIDFAQQSYLVQRYNSNYAFFRYVQDDHPVNLMFEEEHLKALQQLTTTDEIPGAFYYYWNETVNTHSYSSKLLLMFSAIEALVRDKKGKKDLKKQKDILGQELTDDIFNPKTGLRHRLIHGEYYNPSDHSKNYIDLIHKKIMNYFNTQVFDEEILNENVIHPQRHFYGNKSELRIFIQNIKHGDEEINLKSAYSDACKNGIDTMSTYKLAFKSQVGELDDY